MLKLLKSLTQTLGQEFRQQLHTNFLRIEDFVNNLKDLFDFHKSEEKNAHSSKQISDEKFGTVDNGLNVISKRYSNLVLSKAKNSLQEVKDARVDSAGKAHLTLFDRLLSDNVRFETDKNEVMQSVNEAKDKVLAQEFAFDIPNQSWQYLTNLSPWTNSVMQSFHLDNETGIIYMTQVYGDNYKITRLQPNGQFLSQMEIIGGGHGTQNGYRWIDDKLWIYSFIYDNDRKCKLVRFTYRPDKSIGYGDYDMEEVFTGKPELPYMTPSINEHEGMIMYRIQYPESEWDAIGSANYVEVRKLSDVDNRVDKVIYKMDIPRRLTQGAQPMQGCAYDDGKLYWYSGDSDPNVPNFVTVFDLKTGKQLYQKQADVGKIGNEFPGNFAEAEGIQMYYDKGTGKKAMLIGVTVGAGNYRSHQIHGIFMRDVYDKLTAQATPQSMMETGGRTKTLPVLNFTKLSDIIEPGEYYLYTSDIQNLTDFPLPKEMRDAGYWLQVSAPNQAGQVIQTLIRSTFSRDIMQFTRIVSINKFADSNTTTNWNHSGLSSIGGPSEGIPNHITNINQIGIIADKQWYITSDRSKQIKDLPISGVGMTAYVENISTYVFKVTICRVTTTAAVQMYIAYFSTTENKRTSPWTLMDGKNI
ncbi:phage baseplate protein [Staphylococcus pseudoxylosus]|uniref:phage baseplate protein n=1 Tax=Staphylococcus pseudoxylosus TaxID=2282419 RepID=UPI003F569899